MVLFARWTSLPMRSRCLATWGCAGHLLAEVLAHEIQRRLHDAEGIAQLVADAGGELADGGQPLGVAVLRLEVLAIGLEHDRELEVHDLIERGRDPFDLVRIARELGRAGRRAGGRGSGPWP